MSDAREQVGEYRLRKCLQTGMTSQVYEVVEPRSGRHFAMKLLLPEHAANKEHRATLFHEAEVGIKLRHDNVINIIKINKSATNPHFVMEYFPAGDLRTRLTAKDPKEKEFLKANLKKVLKQVATALAYVNATGVVHCDIKPDNVLVNALGQAKIIDFAIAKRVRKGSGSGFLARLLGGGKKKKVQGTYSYMSPEQISNGPLDGRSDIYSFAAMAYELACGRPPFRGASVDEILKKHLTEKPPLVTSFNPDVADEFATYLNKCLAKKRDDRPDHFHRLLMDLKKMKVFKADPNPDDEE